MSTNSEPCRLHANTADCPGPDHCAWTPRDTFQATVDDLTEVAHTTSNAIAATFAPHVAAPLVEGSAAVLAADLAARTVERDAARARLREVELERNIAVNTIAARTPDFDVVSARIQTEQREAADRARLAAEDRVAELQARLAAVPVQDVEMLTQLRAIWHGDDKAREVIDCFEVLMEQREAARLAAGGVS